MKNFFEELERFSLKIFVILIILAFFVGLIVLAFHQSFDVGLNILFVSLIIQAILARKIYFLSWRRYSFSWRQRSEKRRDNIKFVMFDVSNLLFNLVKVATIFATLLLATNHHSFQYNLGIVEGVILVVGLVSLGGFCLIDFINFFFSNMHIDKRREESKKNLRLSLASFVSASFLFFAYVSFGTQLIWLPVFLSIVFGPIMRGLDETEEVVINKLKKRNNRLMSIVFSLAFLLIAIVSTLLQFRASEMSMMSFFHVNILDKTFFFWTLIVIPLLSVVYAIRERLNFEAARREIAKSGRNIQERKEKEAQIERNRQEQQEKLKDRVENIINILIERREITKEDLVFLAQNKNLLPAGKDCVKAITSVKMLEKFLLISNVKSHIVWEPSLIDIFLLMNSLYKKSYTDAELIMITRHLDDFYRSIKRYEHLSGFNSLKEAMQNALLSIPTIEWGGN